VIGGGNCYAAITGAGTVTLTKAGYVTKTSGTLTAVDTSQAASNSANLFELKVTVDDELGNAMSGATVQHNGNSPTNTSTNTYYFASSWADGALTATKTGYNSFDSTVDTRAQTVGTAATGQTTILMNATTPCNSSTSIAAGSAVTCRGFNYVLQLGNSSGIVGSSIQVTGSGWGPSTAGINFTMPVNSSTTLQLVPTAVADGALNANDTINASATGTFNVTVVILNATRGGHVINGLSATGLNDSEAPTFTVTPSIALSSSNVTIGSAMTITLTGATPSAAQQVWFGSTQATVNSGGNSSAVGYALINVTVPMMSGGSLTITVNSTADTTGATAAFTQATTLTPSTSSGGGATSLTATVTGFAASETVTVTMAGASLGSGTANSTGGAVISISVPTGRPAGAYTMTATGGTSGIIATSSFTILEGTIASPPSQTVVSATIPIPTVPVPVEPVIVPVPVVVPSATPEIGVVTITPTAMTATIEPMLQGATAIVNLAIEAPTVTASTGVTSVSITAANSITTAISVSVTRIETRPPGLPLPPKKLVSILEIKTDAVTGDIANGKITFSMTKAEIAAKKLKPGTIKLARFANGAWVELQTTVVFEDLKGFVFEAFTPGFSYFAIVGEEVAAEVPPEVVTPPLVAAVCESVCGTGYIQNAYPDCGCVEQAAPPTPPNYGLLAAVAVVIIAAAYWWYSQNNGGSKPWKKR